MTASAQSSGVKKYIPVLDWLPNYQPSWLRFDLLAGLTTAAVITAVPPRGGEQRSHSMKPQECLEKCNMELSPGSGRVRQAAINR